MSNEQLFKIEIDKEVDDMINWFTRNYEQEISAWIIGKFDDNIIRVQGLLFPHQEVGGASVDTDAKALIKLRKEYGDECLKIIGHFHSHNSMGNFWSQTDDEFISQYMDQREKALFLVSSKANGHRIRLEVRKPIHFTMDECEYDVVTDEIDELGIKLKAIIEEKVTVAAPVVAVAQPYDYAYEGNYHPQHGGGAYSGLTKGDQIIGTGHPQKNGLDDIDRMFDFNKKTNGFVVRGLTHMQYTQIEDIGNHTVRGEGDNTWSMAFTCRKKKDAMKQIQEIKDFLRTEREEMEQALDDIKEDII